MKTLKEKHAELCALITESEVKRRLHNWYNINIRKAAKRQLPLGCNGRRNDPVPEIIDHLNQLTGLAYRSTSKNTRAMIQSRLNEGFTIEDFKKVHEEKCRQWLHDPVWRKYLNPTTLYRPSNFEKYLQEWQMNQQEKQQSSTSHSKVVGKRVNHDEVMKNIIEMRKKQGLPALPTKEAIKRTKERLERRQCPIRRET